MLSTVILIFHSLFSSLLIGLILMQKDKSGGMIAPREASQSLFGSQGSGSFITRLIFVIVGLFFITNLSLSFVNSGHAIKEIDTLSVQKVNT